MIRYLIKQNYRGSYEKGFYQNCYNDEDQEGGVRQKFAEHMPKICSGCHSVPTHQIFSIDNLFFPQHFQDPPIFFRKYKFFPLKFGDLPTFLRKIHIYLIFDPLTSRPLSVFEGLFSDIRFFDEFSSF